MTVTCDIYVAGVKLMTGVCTAGSATIATIADVTPSTGNFGGFYYKGGTNTLDPARGFADWPMNTASSNGPATWTHPPHWPALHGNVTIQATSGSNALGRSINTRIVTDAGSTSVVIKDKWPFTD